MHGQPWCTWAGVFHVGPFLGGTRGWVAIMGGVGRHITMLDVCPTPDVSESPRPPQHSWPISAKFLD